jgi:hypothetical protein
MLPPQCVAGNDFPARSSSAFSPDSGSPAQARRGCPFCGVAEAESAQPRRRIGGCGYFVVLRVDGLFWDGKDWTAKRTEVRQSAGPPDAYADCALAVSCLGRLGDSTRCGSPNGQRSTTRRGWWTAPAAGPTARWATSTSIPAPGRRWRRRRAPRCWGSSAVSQFAEKVGGRIALKVLSLEPIEEPMARGAEAGVRLEMIDEDVRVHQHAHPGRHLVERHRSSSGSRSGCRARYSASSAVPLKPMIP